jgi:hypothetical protein
MGMSVFSECDPDKYFSISTISREKMNKNGLTMTVTELQRQARGSVPFTEIFTGQARENGHRQRTKIYRYADFKN